MQYTDDYRDPTVYFGECLQLATLGANWISASWACSMAADNAYLVSEFSEMKHTFNVDYVNEVNNGFATFFIGLNYNAIDGKYYWEERTNGAKIPVSSVSTQTKIAHLMWVLRDV